MTIPFHEHTVRIQHSLQTRHRAPLAHFDSRHYVQHNLALGDGLEPILEFMDSLPADGTMVQAHRAFTDGDHSVAHLEYQLGDLGPMTGFEVHRWQDGRIVEHWDNLQATPARPNPSGRSMTDGATEVIDRDRTEANKALVERFTSQVLIGGALEVANALVSAEVISHSPERGDGLTAWLNRLAQAHGEPALGERHLRLHKLLGDGNLALVVSEGERRTSTEAGAAAQPIALYDLYRLADGVIAEHWDVVEDIPPRAEWRNDNGKF